MSSRRPKIFVSSVHGDFQDTRLNIAEWARDKGYNAWLFEKLGSPSKWASTTPGDVELVCLDAVANADLYIGLFHRSYGSTARKHFAGISFVDLELFEAFKEGKPIRCYVLESAEANPDVVALLELVKIVVPDRVTVCSSEAKLLETVKRDIDRDFARGSLWRLAGGWFRRFFHELVVKRHPYEESGGLMFLRDQYRPPLPSRFDRSEVAACLERARTLKSYEDQLNTAARAIRMLAQRPWREVQDRETLTLWDEALGVWETAAAWYGLHGPTFAGKLAADNTIVAIRSLIASGGERADLARSPFIDQPRTGRKEDWIRLYATGGALASEHYSIAKGVLSRKLKEYYLQRAEAYVQMAERASRIESDRKREAGLAAILGHIYLHLRRVPEAARVFERSLHLRGEAGLGPASVAEAKADLGDAYARLGRHREAERLLEEGVRDLERAKGAGFAARAKRKLAVYYLRRGSLRRYAKEWIEADAICHHCSIRDQLRGVSTIPRLSARFVAKMFGDPVRVDVVETDSGYRYVDQDDRDDRDAPDD